MSLLHERVKKVLLNSGQTQVSIAKKLHIQPQRITSILMGETPASLERLEAILMLLDNKSLDSLRDTSCDIKTDSIISDIMGKIDHLNQLAESYHKSIGFLPQIKKDDAQKVRIAQLEQVIRDAGLTLP